MTQNPRIVTYNDELLSDQSVHRTYSDGTEAWRERQPDGRVTWRDSKNRAGVDELLGSGILQRTFTDGRVVYAREQGYGRTAWGDGSVVTINKTSFGGQIGAVLTGLGAGALLGSLLLPPQSLSAAEEEVLRKQAASSDVSAGGWADFGVDDFSEVEEDETRHQFMAGLGMGINLGADDFFG